MVRELRFLMAGVNTAATWRGQKTLVRQQRRMNEAMHRKLSLGVNMLMDRMIFAQASGVVMTTSSIK